MPSGAIFVFLIFSIPILDSLALTDNNDLSVLMAIKYGWKNLPPNWKGSNPCGGWDGINCTGSRVISLMLQGLGLVGSSLGDIPTLKELKYLDLSNNIDLKGTLPPSIGNLKNLSILMLSGCSFFGPIPDSLGSLTKLTTLSLNSNKFTGPIPSSIGNLSNLLLLDLSGNRLTGPIPVSNGTAPGLDMLLKAQHFHLSRNRLNGTIQPRLFSPDMNLIHLLLDHNQLTGEIPITLGYVQTLELIRLDWNSINGSVPSNLNNLTNISALYLSNNNLTGPIPNLTGMNALYYLDTSNNSFDPSAFPPWLSSIQSLTTLVMENASLQGQIPVNFFNLPELQNVTLSNNKLSGNLDIGDSYSNSLALDLQNNSVTGFHQQASYNIELTLVGNPICQGNEAARNYCEAGDKNSFIPPSNKCASISCSSNKILSPNCRCSNPYTGTMHFYSSSVSDIYNNSYYRPLNGSLMFALLSSGVPVDSVNVRNPSIDVYSYLQFEVQIFPSGEDSFNRTAISTIASIFIRQLFPIPGFGPFLFFGENYCCFAASGDNKSSHTGAIVGASVVGAVLFMLGGFYVYHRKRARREDMMNNPFASWNPDEGNGGIPQLTVARWFSFDDLSKCTNSFSESNCLGSGGYGKVYKGILASGQVVAIKRAQQGSMQGALEFKTEIELLSRIHHKNVVGLVGFCYDQGEQMLVYEYISNGTLRECLSGKSGIRLDWMKRLGIALDAARGLTYLHELASPPIIHRDIKSNNILLDDHCNAKVADFGLSKLISDETKDYITTQVKGTMGYMDPEYYMTQQLTEKSDVYSFGIVLLELITARAPIERGKYIVKVVRDAMNSPKDTSYLYEILDPKIGGEGKLGGLEKFLDLAMRCVQEYGTDRPTMNEVVREIENIMHLAALKKNPKAEVTYFTSKDSMNTSYQHSSGSGDFDYSVGSLPFSIDSIK